ncbi:MAG: RluA family pseudouridine synthase [Armatimonadetes bacterium]|nr:RluA family pseudouridine synthase [Armatimonadota bacterium]
MTVEPPGGVRLDAYLAARLHTFSRSRLQALIAGGLVAVNGTVRRASRRVRPGDVISVTVPPPEPSDLTPEPLALDVIYEDGDILVIHKPAGLTVHPGAGRPGGTLVNAIIARNPDLRGVGGVLRPGIVHRLDKDTSGLLVVAKHDAALRALQAQIAARSVSRRYLALVHGTVAPEQGMVDAPIGRHPVHRKRRAVVPGGRRAVTHYRVLERFGEYTLIEASLETGRTHQIRVHMAHIGHPVAGDPVYGWRRNAVGLERQALHAYRLAFDHPGTGERVGFEAPLPEDLTAALERLRTGAEG